MKWIRKWEAFAPFLSALILLCLAAVSLGDYQAAVYDMEVWDTEQEMSSDSTEDSDMQEPVSKPEAASETKEPEDAQQDITAEDISEIDLTNKADGVYEGVGTGFAGKIRVSVEVKDKKIIAIKILSAEADTPSYMERAKGMIEKILAAQSVKVDTVSGATYSSRGILRAVKNALTGESDDGVTASQTTQGVGAGSLTLPPASDAGKYKDGVYEGTGTGFAGEIRVKVTIADGKITKIELLSIADGAEYAQKAAAVIDWMLAAQRTDVDTVSGATYSSVGIISAVRDALSKAADDGAKQEEEETTKKTGKFPYQDGVYFGTAKGFSGDITVAAVIQEKTLQAVIVTEAQDDAAYLNRAKAVAEEIVQKQTTNVDTVSGATYSSKGIKKAVKAAIKEAKKGNSVKKPGNTAETEETSPVTGTVPYKDGVYFGTGNGFLGEIEVGLSIADKTIRAIVVTKTQDDETFFGRAKAVIDKVQEQQNTDVDTVSGATFSSKGILEAINQALSEAKRITEGGASAEETNPPQDTEEPEKEPQDTEEPTVPEETLYQDGVYAVSVLCRPDEYEDFKSYHLMASIEIKGDKIIAITELAGDGSASNDPYIRRAAEGVGTQKGVVSQILQKGNADGIDAVSGATCSSQAISDACTQAFLKAKK